MATSKDGFSKGIVVSISGPVIEAEGMDGVKKYELVEVILSETQKLLGEVLRIKGSLATIQVYEDTSNLQVGDKVVGTGSPLSVQLGPGLLGNIYDGIQRPLKKIREQIDPNTGEATIYIPRGISLPPLDEDIKWKFFPDKTLVGTTVTAGCVVGYVHETHLIPKHLIMVPFGVSGTLEGFASQPDNEFTIKDNVYDITHDDGTIKSYTMVQTWPVRVPRPKGKEMMAKEPLIIGQRVLDALFPAVKGGTVCIPGAFGCGKTVISQSMSKFSNTDLIVYVGCGERGNEMAEVLQDFAELKKVKDGKAFPAMERTILVANTSNMPVTAREASIYTGITIAEYFRDQGLDVALMADSSSRWAEALREISGRLGEMPADRGYPAYLGSKLSSFYERAGKALVPGLPEREGSVSIVAAVSPAGGDLSDPVTVATMAIVQVFWGLDKTLAHKKHYPAINTGISYSKATASLDDFYEREFPHMREQRISVAEILKAAVSIDSVVKLVGQSALDEVSKVTLAVAKVITEDFLQQNSFSEHDAYCPIWKTDRMMRTILAFHKAALASVGKPSLNTWAQVRETTAVELQNFAKLTKVLLEGEFSPNEGDKGKAVARPGDAAEEATVYVSREELEAKYDALDERIALLFAGL